MRLSRFSLLAALLLGAVGCKEADLAPVVAKIPPLAFVRYINAVPDTLNTTVRWIDAVEFTPQTFTNVPFRGMGQGGYQGLQAGARTLRVFTYDPNLNSSANGLGAETKQLTELTHTFEAGKYYTLLHLGYARTGRTPQQRVLVIEDQLPAAGTTVSVRAIHAGLGLPNVDLFATSAATTAISGSPAFANVGLTNGTAGISAYLSRTAGALAVQATAVGSTGSLISAAAPTGVAGSTAADPIAGATIGGSVLTAIAFPAPDSGSKAATFTETIASGRVAESITGLASGFDVTDSVAASWAAGRFATTKNSSWTLTATAPACPAGTVICETRPGARTVKVVGNTNRVITIAADTGAIFRRSTLFSDTLLFSADTGRFVTRAVDTVVAVDGGFEVRDLREVRDSIAANWTASRFGRADTVWTLTITPAACPTVTAPTTVGCATRPKATRARITANSRTSLTTAADLSAFARAYYFDTVRAPNSDTQIIRSGRTTVTVQRNTARNARTTYAITGTNPPSIVWFLDRNPARTTP